MAEQLGASVEPIPAFEVPNGIPLPDMIVRTYEGTEMRLYNTNNFQGYLRVVATDMSPDTHYAALALQRNTALQAVINKFTLDYPRLWGRLSALQREQDALEQSLRQPGASAEVRAAYREWQRARIDSNEKVVLLDMAFRAMLPSMVQAGISPLSVTA